MLRLAVATNAETLGRIRDPLSERGIDAEHVPTAERVQPLSEPFVEESFDAGFVYPSRLMEGGVADALLDVPWVNDREAILRSRNKTGALARLREAGIETPESVYVSNQAAQSELRAAFELFDPPVVVKPNSTTRGVGIAKAHDLDSFLGICDYLSLIHDYRAVSDQSFLVQEYLPDARDYRAMVVDGEYVGAVERRLPDDERAAGRWKHNVHRGAEAVGVELPDTLQRLAEDAAAALDIDWLGVDILVTDDRAVVNETNARPTVDAATKYEPDFYDRLAELIRATAR
ncbi:MAG: ribosomal protein S6--L-glutamate ligase [Natronomonas sp.]|jgi:ribosomal protein S6--L-glutamate ligase|uniref:ATP-grasp domain-containing protein n=1 Tax=Natronomonas sp. TaxID=2184060 RepID=UPI003988B6B8